MIIYNDPTKTYMRVFHSQLNVYRLIKKYFFGGLNYDWD